MSDSTDPLKPGYKTSEAWIAALATIALPVIAELAKVPVATQVVVAVVVVAYMASRTAPKIAKAYGQGKSESGV